MRAMSTHATISWDGGDPPKCSIVLLTDDPVRWPQPETGSRRGDHRIRQTRPNLLAMGPAATARRRGHPGIDLMTAVWSLSLAARTFMALGHSSGVPSRTGG